jgi:hypothetical protein
MPLTENEQALLRLYTGRDDNAPAGENRVVAIRESVQRLVAIDVVSGGAAVAELAEVTGWLLCDANPHSMSRARNRQALTIGATRW